MLRTVLVLIAASLVACRTTPAPPLASSGEVAADGPTWTWTALEYFGPAHLGRSYIQLHLPFAMGTPWTEAALPELDAWCAEFVAEHDIGFHDCATLRYVDGRAIAVVNFADEAPVYLAAPLGDSALPDPALADIWERIRQRREALFEAQQFDPLQETFEGGYLSWADPTLASLADELAAAAPPHRVALTELVIGAADPDVRALAANLLNYAGDHAASIRETLLALADTDTVVRNDLSRYYLHAVGSVDDAGGRKSLALALAEQARRPSMSDRNKALYALTTLAEGFPEDRQMLLDAAGLVAGRLASRSVLPNVGGAARGLLATLGGPPPVPSKGSLAIDPSTDHTAALTAYVELFNAHDPAAMAAACHPELEVWYVDGGGMAGLGTAGPAALKSELDGYFANYPDVRSDPTELVALDDFVWFVERVSWADKSQASPAVYQFEDGKLRRAWYHPAVRD